MPLPLLVSISEFVCVIVPAVETDVSVRQERICQRACESPLLVGSTPVVR